jgi:peptide/nickel transport system substrate-binding protein
MRPWRKLAAAGFTALLIGVIGPTQAQVYLEAPELAAQVKAGKLPTVEQRLPANPMLVETTEKIGRYGGTWRMGMRASADHASLVRTIGYENLVRWTADWSGIIPNIAQSIEVNNDGTEFTFVLRQGMKWSDGAPFTADDILFWYENVLLDPHLTPSIPFWLTSGGKPVRVEQSDEATVKFIFTSPNSLFLQWLARPEGAEPTSYPKHYLSRFHPAHNAALRGDAAWADKFRSVFGIPGTIDDPTRWQHPDVPTLHAWVLTGAYGEADPLVAVRNPYYWKVDPAGQQLPYLSRVSFAVVKATRDVADLALSGEIDMQTRHVRCCADEILAARADYKAVRIIPTETNELILSFNLNHRDPSLRDVFNSRDFRIALSLGIDRAAIIRDRDWVAWQPAPLPQSRHYHDRMATQYLDLDQDRANSLLDGLALDRRDDRGRRLSTGGSPIAFKVITFTETRLEMLRQIQKDWLKLGVEMTPELLERQEFTRRVEANEFDATGNGGDGGIDAIVYAQDYIPLGLDTSWGIPWWYWYENPSNPRARVPPAPVRRQYELYELIKATTDPTEQQALMREILDIAADEFFAIGVLRYGFDDGIIRRGFRNVPEFFMNSWSYPNPAPTNPAQYFIELSAP